MLQVLKANNKKKNMRRTELTEAGVYNKQLGNVQSCKTKNHQILKNESNKLLKHVGYPLSKFYFRIMTRRSFLLISHSPNS